MDTSVTVPNYVGTQVSATIDQITALGLKTEVVGEGAQVLAQVPAAGSQLEEGSRVVLYTGTEQPEDTIIVPDLYSMSASVASWTLSQLGLNIYISGSQERAAYVYLQDIAPDTMVPPGTVIRVKMVTGGLSDA